MLLFFLKPNENFHFIYVYFVRNTHIDSQRLIITCLYFQSSIISSLRNVFHIIQKITIKTNHVGMYNICMSDIFIMFYILSEQKRWHGFGFSSAFTTVPTHLLSAYHVIVKKSINVHYITYTLLTFLRTFSSIDQLFQLSNLH